MPINRLLISLLWLDLDNDYTSAVLGLMACSQLDLFCQCKYTPSSLLSFI
jgi:hypothetical protein